MPIKKHLVFKPGIKLISGWWRMSHLLYTRPGLYEAREKALSTPLPSINQDTLLLCRNIPNCQLQTPSQIRSQPRFNRSQYCPPFNKIIFIFNNNNEIEYMRICLSNLPFFQQLNSHPPSRVLTYLTWDCN